MSTHKKEPAKKRSKPLQRPKPSTFAAHVGQPPCSQPALKTGPVYYTEELAAEICDRIAAGTVPRRLFLEPGMPNRKTVYTWRRQNPGFERAYQFARLILILDYIEETIAIADEPVSSPEQVERNRLRISSRQWYAERLMNGLKIE